MFFFITEFYRIQLVEWSRRDLLVSFCTFYRVLPSFFLLPPYGFLRLEVQLLFGRWNGFQKHLRFFLWASLERVLVLLMPRFLGILEAFFASTRPVVGIPWRFIFSQRAGMPFAIDSRDASRDSSLFFPLFCFDWNSSEYYQSSEIFFLHFKDSLKGSLLILGILQRDARITRDAQYRHPAERSPSRNIGRVSREPSRSMRGILEIPEQRMLEMP